MIEKIVRILLNKFAKVKTLCQKYGIPLMISKRAFYFIWNDQLTNTLFQMNMPQVLINLILFCSLRIFVLQSKSLGKIVLFIPSPSETHETIPTFEK